MGRALVWLNLYGREAVRRKLKKQAKKCIFCAFTYKFILKCSKLLKTPNGASSSLILARFSSFSSLRQQTNHMKLSSNYRFLLTETDLGPIEICSDSNFYTRNKTAVFPFKTRYLSQKSYLLAIFIQYKSHVFFIIFTKDQINKYNASPQVMPIPNT